MDVVPVMRTASERRLARKGITLRDGVLKPKTRQLYRAAFLRLWGWIDCPPPERVTNVPAYDRVLAEFIEYAWSAGHTRGDAGNALSSSLAAYPELRGKGNLTESWYMLNSWARYEVPIRAPPLPPQVLLALVWYCVRRRQLGAAFLLAAGYDAFLRTGEMLSLTIADVSIDADDRGIIKLAHTKTGQRHAAFEVATVNDPLVGQLFRQYRRALPAGTHEEHYIFAGSAKSFCQLFDDGLKWLSLQSYKFKPYSIRRGGATAFYRRTRQMEFTLERGR